MKKMVCFAALFLLMVKSQVYSQSICLGAYYFNGWSSPKDPHLTSALLTKFPERQPKWGWVTGTPAVMKDQIDYAANAGLSFFCFCWYYPEKNKANFRNDPLNQGLNNYLSAPNQSRLKFCILATNHNGFTIGPEDWDVVSGEWLKLFKNSQYLKVDGKPLLIIYSLQTLVDKFGSDQAVKAAIDKLKSQAANAGLSGVTVAACVPTVSGNIGQAKNCGVDIFTGYNYHAAGFNKADIDSNSTESISSLTSKSVNSWNFFNKYNTPVIPVATLNWDPRPWRTQGALYAKSPRYTGFSGKSAYNSISTMRQWMDAHPQNITKERVALIYAWNEYGEGAWLTPSLTMGNQLLEGVKAAVMK